MVPMREMSETTPPNRTKPPRRVDRRSLLRRRTKRGASWTLIISVGIHLVLSLFLALRMISIPPPEHEAVIHVRLAVPEDPELEQAPVEEEGLVEELPEEGLPVPAEEPSDQLETADEVEQEDKARGDASARGGEDASDLVGEPAVFGVGGADGGRFGWEGGGGIVESGFRPGARKGLQRFRADGLDVVICLDVSGSMSDTLETNKREAEGLIRMISALVPEVRFGLISYSDAVESKQPLTFDHLQILTALRALGSSGGGDECVEAALEQALDPGGMGWRPHAWRSVIIVGDEPADPKDRRECIATVRSAAKANERLIVNTFSATNGQLVPSFAEIAAAGRGEALIAGEEYSVGRALVRLAFGAEVGAEVDRWIDEHPKAAIEQYGIGNLGTSLVKIGLDPKRSPVERLDALVTAARNQRTARAVGALLDVIVQHPDLLKIPRAIEEVCAAVGARPPVHAIGEAQRRREATLTVARAAGDLGSAAARGALLKLLERERTIHGDPGGRRIVATALARVGGQDAGDVVAELLVEDPELLDPATLLTALVRSPSATLRDELLKRLATDPTFRASAFGASDPQVHAIVDGLIAQRVATDETFREICLADGGGPFRVAVAALLAKGDEARADIAGRLLGDRAFRERTIPLLGEQDRFALGLLLFEGVLRDGADDAAALARDERVLTLAALGAETVGAILATSVDDDERLARATRVIAALERALPGDAWARLLRESDIPLDVLVAAVPRVTRKLAERLQEGDRTELRTLVARAKELSPEAGAALAIELGPALDRTDGMRRRNLFRLFADLTDVRGVETLVAAMRWDGGKLAPEAIEGLRRVTELPFAKAARSKKKRAAQVLEIEWWWAKASESGEFTPR